MGSELTKAQQALSDFDTCECGDYRRDHRDGAGRCSMPDDATHGFKPCFQFRLSRAATEVPSFYARLDLGRASLAKEGKSDD